MHTAEARPPHKTALKSNSNASDTPSSFPAMADAGKGFGAHRRGGAAAPPAVDPALLKSQDAAKADADASKGDEGDQPRGRRGIVTKPDPSLVGLQVETKGGVEIDKVTRKPVIRFEEQKDPWVEEEMKKWEEERQRIKEKRLKLEQEHKPEDAASKAIAQIKLTAPTNDPAQQEKNRAAFLEKRRTIGVATPHSHFFAELEAARKAAAAKREEEQKKGGAAGGAPPAAAAAPATPAPAAAKPAAGTDLAFRAFLKCALTVVS